jgi:hypothetical protein
MKNNISIILFLTFISFEILSASLYLKDYYDNLVKLDKRSYSNCDEYKIDYDGTFLSFLECLKTNCENSYLCPSKVGLIIEKNESVRLIIIFLLSIVTFSPVLLVISWRFSVLTDFVVTFSVILLESVLLYTLYLGDDTISMKLPLSIKIFTIIMVVILLTLNADKSNSSFSKVLSISFLLFDFWLMIYTWLIYNEIGDSLLKNSTRTCNPIMNDFERGLTGYLKCLKMDCSYTCSHGFNPTKKTILADTPLFILSISLLCQLSLWIILNCMFFLTKKDNIFNENPKIEIVCGIINCVIIISINSYIIHSQSDIVEDSFLKTIRTQAISTVVIMSLSIIWKLYKTRNYKWDETNEVAIVQLTTENQDEYNRCQNCESLNSMKYSVCWNCNKKVINQLENH